MKDLKSLLYALPSALAVCLANKDVQKLLGTVPGFDLVKEGSAAIVGAVAPELAGHFICQISFDRIRDQFKHPWQLNHLERLLKDATVRSVGVY